MAYFVDHLGWVLHFFTAFVFCAAYTQPYPMKMTRTDNSNSCNATFLTSSGRWDYANVGESVTFWLKFSVPSLPCIYSESFVWYNCCQPVAKVAPIRSSYFEFSNVYISNYTIKSISEADFGELSYKVSGATLQTFFISQERKCHDELPNATNITLHQTRPSGSTVTISCSFVGDSSELTADIDWYHNGTYIGDDPDSKKFDTTKPPQHSVNCTFSRSLIIHNATVMESGKYKCLPVSVYGTHTGTSQTTTLEIVPLPTVSYERQLSCQHSHVCMQWKVAGYSSHTQLLVVVNELNFTEYKYNISPAFDGSMLYTVNITKSGSVPVGDNEVQLCALVSFDSEGTKKSCSDAVAFTVSSSELAYYLSLGMLIVVLAVVAVSAIIVIYMVKHNWKKKGHKEEMRESVHQPLLSSSLSTRRSFYDSIHSWTLSSSVVRAAQRFTTSVSIKAFGQQKDGGNKMVFILYCKPNGPDGNCHVNDVEILAECLDLGSRNFRCEFDGWHNEYVAVWSNWTTRMITKAHFVILVCTKQFYSNLSQEMGQTFETCRGTVSSAAVTNLLTTYCHKFIPVFLNTQVKRKYIPPALLSTTAYELNLKELDTYIAENGEKIGKREAMHHYLADALPSMDGLVRLLKHLRGEQ